MRYAPWLSLAADEVDADVVAAVTRHQQVGVRVVIEVGRDDAGAAQPQTAYGRVRGEDVVGRNCRFQSDVMKRGHRPA